MTEKSLSKNLLQMKFMQRTKDRVEAVKCENILSVEERHLSKSHSNEQRHTSKFVYEHRIAVLENLLECPRLSFKGFNPEVEKCMAHNRELRKEKLEKLKREKQGKDVGDEEMAARFSSISKNIAKKFSKKRHRNDLEDQDEQEDVNHSDVQDYRPRRKFRKPRD